LGNPDPGVAAEAGGAVVVILLAAIFFRFMFGG